MQNAIDGLHETSWWPWWKYNTKNMIFVPLSDPAAGGG